MTTKHVAILQTGQLLSPQISTESQTVLFLCEKRQNSLSKENREGDVASPPAPCPPCKCLYSRLVLVIHLDDSPRNPQPGTRRPRRSWDHHRQRQTELRI